MSVRLGPGTKVLAARVCDACQVPDVKEVTIGRKPRCLETEPEAKTTPSLVGRGDTISRTSAACGPAFASSVGQRLCCRRHSGQVGKGGRWEPWSLLGSGIVVRLIGRSEGE